jgi:hypothetical protein
VTVSTRIARHARKRRDDLDEDDERRNGDVFCDDSDDQHDHHQRGFDNFGGFDE